MRLSVIKHTAKNHASSPWLVVIPRRLSSTGRRQFHYFDTKAAAETYAASVRKEVRQHGESSAVLSGGLSADARLAHAILNGSGISLVQAALLATQLLNDGRLPSGLPAVPADNNGTQADEKATPATDCSRKHPLSRRTVKRHTLASVLKAMQAGKMHQSPHTLRSRSARFNSFFRRNAGLARTPIELISAKDIQRALDNAWASAPTSWNSMLTHLSALFNYAVRKGIIPVNPLVSIDRKYVREKEIKPLAPETLQALLMACRPPNAEELSLGSNVPPAVRQELALDTSDLAAYIAIAAFAGIRPTEAMRLKWGDINLEDGCISVRRTTSKTGGTRHVDIHPTLHAWLAPLLPEARAAGAPIFRAGSRLVKRLRAVRRRAGFDAANPWPEDALRHSYASYYLKAGGSLDRLQLNMGHASTALIYARYCNMHGLTRDMAVKWWGLTPDMLYGKG